MLLIDKMKKKSREKWRWNRHTVCPPSGHPVFHGRSEVCSVVIWTSLTCRFRVFHSVSVPRNPTVRSVRHMAAKRSPTRVLPTKLHCCSFDTCFFKARLCASNENNVTRRQGKPFYGHPREDLQFLSRGPLIASIRRCGSCNSFLCLRSWFLKFVQCFRLSKENDWLQQKNLKEIGKFLKKWK